jgi:DNA-binding NarL/FixJ family response regulator
MSLTPSITIGELEANYQLYCKAMKMLIAENRSLKKIQRTVCWSRLDTLHHCLPRRYKVALAMKGLFFLRCLCESFSAPNLIGCAVTDEASLKVVVLALGDAIPQGYSEAEWIEAVVAEADYIEDQKPLQAAVIAVMGHHSYRSPSLRTGTLPYLSCPRLTPREYEVPDLLASGLTDKEIPKQLVVSEETARTHTKRP